MILLIPTLIFVLIYLVLTLPLLIYEKYHRKRNALKADTESLHIAQFAIRVAALLSGMKLTVYGRENIPKDEAVLYAANHNGIFDVLATYPLMPGRTGFVAKDVVEKVPLLSSWMKRLNCLFLDRKDPRAGMQMILDSIDMIKNGISVFIFPEGTRSKDGKLGDFKAGSVKMATKTGCAIIPVAITGTRECLEERKFFRFRHPVTVTFGKPIYPKELEAEEQKFLAAYVQKKVEEMLP